MRPCVEGGLIHVSCANWVPELRLDTDSGMISGTYLIDPRRFTLMCFYCSKRGACVQCMYGKCMYAYHPSCVQKASAEGAAFCMPTHDVGGWKWKFSCGKHARFARSIYLNSIRDTAGMIEYVEKENKSQSETVSTALSNSADPTTIGSVTDLSVAAHANTSGSAAVAAIYEDEDEDSGEEREIKLKDQLNPVKRELGESGLASRSNRLRTWRGLPMQYTSFSYKHGIFGSDTKEIEKLLYVSNEEKKLEGINAQYRQQGAFWEHVVNPFFSPLDVTDASWLLYNLERGAGEAAKEMEEKAAEEAALKRRTSGQNFSISMAESEMISTYSGFDDLTQAELAIPPRLIAKKFERRTDLTSMRVGSTIIYEKDLIVDDEEEDTRSSKEASNSPTLVLGMQHGPHIARVDIQFNDTPVTPAANSNNNDDDIDKAAIAASAEIKDWSILPQDALSFDAVATKRASMGQVLLQSSKEAMDKGGDPGFGVLLHKAHYADGELDELGAHIALLQEDIRKERSASALRIMQLAARVQAEGECREAMQKVGLVLDEDLVVTLLGRKRFAPEAVISGAGFGRGLGGVSAPKFCEALPWQYPVFHAHEETDLHYRGSEMQVLPPLPPGPIASTFRLTRIPPPSLQKRLVQAIKECAIWKNIVRHLENGLRDHASENSATKALKKILPASWTIKVEGRPPAAKKVPGSTDVAHLPPLPEVCSVCFDGDASVDDDPILQCEKCRVFVHKRCYGVVDDPCLFDDEVPFLCAVCGVEEQYAFHNKAAKRPDSVCNPRPHCQLCPVRRGALKMTTEGAWCHIFCALWTPGVELNSLIRMGPINLQKMKRGGQKESSSSEQLEKEED